MNVLSLTWWRQVYAKGGRPFAVVCAAVFIVPIVFTAGLSIFSHSANSNSAQGGTLVTVNGEAIPTTELQYVAAEKMGGKPGMEHAGAVGQVIFSVVTSAAVQQMAKKQNIHATDADIDKLVAKDRESKVGPNTSDADWDNYLSERYHLSPSEYRDHLSGTADIQALFDHYKNAEKVTLDDAHNQYSEVKLATVFVKVLDKTSSAIGSPPSLPDVAARKKIDDLHVKAAGGADVVKLAVANPDPMSGTKSTGISDWRKENDMQMGSSFFFGKDFDDAVHKTAKGGITDVIKASGFQSGYVFAKVVDRRTNLPADFNVAKVTDDLKSQRGMKKLSDDIKAAVKHAKVVFPSYQETYKAYYDFAKLQEMQQEMSPMAQAPDPPTEAEVTAQQALVDKEFEAAQKAHPDDTTLALVLAQTLQSKMFTTSPDKQAAVRDQLIKLYETAFKSTEDIPTRFILEGLYRDKHDYKSAFKQLAQVNKLLNEDPAYDHTTRTAQMASRQQLIGALQALPANDAPDAAGLAAEQGPKIQDLATKIKLDEAAEAQKRADDEVKRIKDEAKRKADEKAAADKAKSNPTPPPAKGAAARAPGAGIPPPTGGTVPPGTASGITGGTKPGAPAPAPGTGKPAAGGGKPAGP